MPDPTGLLYQNSKEGPGLHVILIGVSAYRYGKDGPDEIMRNFEIGQLTSPASTVQLLADWFIKHANDLQCTLKTLRVLASPSPRELQKNNLLNSLLPATLKNVTTALLEWQKNASQSNDDATIFYFAGHGIQRSRGDSLLLLEDFLGGVTDLDRTIDVNNIYQGMGSFNLFPFLAKTQLYFIDACRSDIAELNEFERQEAAPVFRVQNGGIDDRNAPIFSAASPGNLTYSIPMDRTIFAKDLLTCLSGEAADNVLDKNGKGIWVVTLGSLYQAMAKMVTTFNIQAGASVRSLYLDNSTADTPSWTLCRLVGPPQVPCIISTNPDEAAKEAIIHFDIPMSTKRIPIPVGNNPLKFTKPAGIYALEGLAPDGRKPVWKDIPVDYVRVMPPFFERMLSFPLEE